jgi:hypothetical protein
LRQEETHAGFSFGNEFKQAGSRCPAAGIRSHVIPEWNPFSTSIIHIFYKTLQYYESAEQARSSENRQVFRSGRLESDSRSGTGNSLFQTGKHALFIAENRTGW